MSDIPRRDSHGGLSTMANLQQKYEDPRHLTVTPCTNNTVPTSGHHCQRVLSPNVEDIGGDKCGPPVVAALRNPPTH